MDKDMLDGNGTLVSERSVRRKDYGPTGTAPSRTCAGGSIRTASCAKAIKPGWRLAAILVILMCFACSPPSLSAQNFAEQLNPTGDPIGGGPGYDGSWRTARGYAGDGIYTEADADHVVTTESELRALASSYYDRSTGQKVTPSGSATSGEVVFIKGDETGVLLLNNTLELDFSAGVTVASDLGYQNGDGTYEWGASVRVTKPWDDFQVKALFAPTNEWRLTGLRLDGHSTWGQGSNANHTDEWQGSSMGIRIVTDYGEEFEVDNVWLFGFPYAAVMMYKGPALAHHLRVSWSRWQGYGYGFWPGRDPVIMDGQEYTQRLIGWQIEEGRHGTDQINVGVSDQGDGTYASADEQVLTIKHGILAGAFRYTHLNAHGRGHHATFSHVAELDDRTITRGLSMVQGWPSGAPGGGYTIDNLWLQHNTPLDNLQIGGYSAAVLLADPTVAPPDAGPVNIDFESIHGNGNGLVLPVVNASLSSNTITAGQSVALALTASDPDGHTITYYEVRWGDRFDVREGTEFYSPGETPSRVFNAAGVYQIKVLAYNEFGIRGEKDLILTVNPTDAQIPVLSYARAPEVPPSATAEHDWSGYFTVRLFLNGVVLGTYDWGATAASGWQWQTADVSALMEDANTIQFTFEIETQQNISDPDASEPGRAVAYLSNLWLHNVPGILAEDSWVSKADPLFTTARRYTVENDWQANGSLARAGLFDTPSDIGRILRLSHRNPSAGTKTTWSSPVFDYLHPPRNLAVARTSQGTGITATWDTQALSDRVNVRFYRLSDGELGHSALDITDAGSYTWSDASDASHYVEVEAVARHWKDPSKDVTTRAASSANGGNSSGNTSINFEAARDLSGGNIVGLSVVDLADVNDDGLLDVGVFEGGKGAGGRVTFAWLESPADPGTGSWMRHNLPKPSPFRPFIGAAQFGDVDEDNDPDIVVSMDNHSGSVRSAYIYLLENQEGTWDTHTIASDLPVHHINDMQLADLDGDGALDVVVRSLDPNQLHFYFQNSTTDWEERVIDASPYGATGEGFAIGDIDGEGTPDISISGHWLKGPANPRTDSYASHGIDTNYKNANANVKEAIGDINGDGRNDVIISPAEGYRGGDNHVLAWYEAPANPEDTNSWTQHVLATDFNGGHTIKLADMDGDGDLDVISGVAWNKWGQTRHISIYFNQGGAFPDAPQIVSSDKGLYTGVIGDIGNDLDLDIVGQDTYSNGSHPFLYESLLAQSDTSDTGSGTPVHKREFNLGKNYPNPFRHSTTIEYSLPETAEVDLVVYDALGRRVAALVDGEQKAGTYHVTFNAAHLSSGLYIYRLRAGDLTDSGMTMLVK